MYKNNFINGTFLGVFLTFIQTFDNIIRIQIRSGTGFRSVIKIYGSGFKSRRPFMLTTAFLTDTGVSYWRRVFYWHLRFYWHGRFLPTSAFHTDTGNSYWHQRLFLTDTGVSYRHWRFILIPVFLTDTGVSYWYRRFLLTPAFLTNTGFSHWHRRFSYCRWCSYRHRPHTETSAAEKGPAPLSLWQLHCGCRASWQSLNSMYGERKIFLSKLKYQAERVQSHLYIEKLRKSVIFVCVYYTVNLVRYSNDMKIISLLRGKLIYNGHTGSGSRTLLFSKNK